MLRAPIGPVIGRVDGKYFEWASHYGDDKRIEQRLREHAARDRLRELAGPDHGGEVNRLLSVLEEVESGCHTRIMNECWRDVGCFLVSYGLGHAWQALFHRYGLKYTAGEVYRPNDEWRFLWPSGWRDGCAENGMTPTPEPKPIDEAS